MPETSTRFGVAVRDYREQAYGDFCAYQGLAPQEPCPWTWEQAVRYRRGQRTRDRLDKVAGVAARYISGYVPAGGFTR